MACAGRGFQDGEDENKSFAGCRHSRKAEAVRLGESLHRIEGSNGYGMGGESEKQTDPRTVIHCGRFFPEMKKKPASPVTAY